jgi:hypothetical protein
MSGIMRVEYYYITLPHHTGEGAKVINALKAEHVNLLAFNGFPISAGRAQLDFVTSDPAGFLKAAQKLGFNAIGPKTAFLVQGHDRVGAIADVVNRLAEARVNITSIQAVATGEGLYGAILWVKPRSVAKAAQALGVC